jgi:hypothetical protein
MKITYPGAVFSFCGHIYPGAVFNILWTFKLNTEGFVTSSILSPFVHEEKSLPLNF